MAGARAPAEDDHRGASAYSRTIDFKAFREIADEVGAILFADVAHIAGLIAGGVHPNALPHAHVVASTTHKTLRGPRGGSSCPTTRNWAPRSTGPCSPATRAGRWST